MAPAPLSMDGVMSPASPMTCVLVPQARASPEICLLSGESAEPSTSIASDADAMTRIVSARSEAA